MIHCLTVRLQLLALAILLTITGHAAAQTGVIPPAMYPRPGAVPPSEPAGRVLPEASGRFIVLTPGWPSFVVLPKSHRGFKIVPLSDDPPSNSGS